MKLFNFVLNAYQRDHLPHAFLVTGIESIEKTDFIDKTAKLLLCGSPESMGACGKCHACHWLSQGVHPDFCVLRGEKESITIEHFREMHTFLEKTPHQNRSKVIIIHDVDTLSIYTANALLKNLEEPPDRTVFILTALKKQNVISTIRSRCVPIHFNSLPKLNLNEDNSCKDFLFWGIDSLFNQEMIFEKITAETLETLYLFYNWLIEYCRYGLTNNTEYLSVIDEKPKYDNLLKILPVEKAMSFVERITDAIETVSVTNLNKELLWGSLMMQWQQMKEKGI